MRVHGAAGEQRSEKIGRSQKLRSQSLEKVQSRESGLLGGSPKVRKSRQGDFSSVTTAGEATNHGLPTQDGKASQRAAGSASSLPSLPSLPCRPAWQPAQITPARAIQSLPLPLPGSGGPGAEGDGRSHILL